MITNKKIPPEHLVAFRALLVGLEQVIPIDWVNINPYFEKAEWPNRHESGTVLAVPVAIRNQCLPFNPCICFTAPPNHVSKITPVLEFKLLDGNHSTGKTEEDTVYFPVVLSLFPSGRKILKIYGLTLDTKSTTSSYEENTMLIDKRLFERLSRVTSIVRHLIESFPITDGDRFSTECRAQALADLEQPVQRGGMG